MSQHFSLPDFPQNPNFSFREEILNRNTYHSGHEKCETERKRVIEGKRGEAASVQMYTETFDHSIKEKQAKIYSETTNDSQSSKNSNPEVVNGSGSSSDSERQIDVITRGESGENNYPGTHVNGTKSLSSSGGRSSSSSSLSVSSSDDYFGMDALKFTASNASTLASKSGKNYVSISESSAKSEVDNNPPVPTSTYQVYNLTYNQKGMSPTVSPPIQAMDRSGRYDSSRIPASVFERNTNPLEWSIASNDSLFSLHIGPNNSFSREHTFKFAELGISEELTKSGELNMFNRIPSVTIEEIEIARKSVEVEKLQTTKTSDEASKLEQNLSEDQNEIKTSHQAASCKSSKTSMSSLSHESGTIAHSFVPLKKRSRPFCYCCNCSSAFCCHTWPTCCITWPSCKCSCCGWVFCCCCNCSHTKSSDNASPILTETERNSFVKADTPRQQSYKEESETTSNSSASCWYCFQSKQASEVTSNSSANCCYWFHCFSCPSCTWRLSFSCPRCKCCC